MAIILIIILLAVIGMLDKSEQTPSDNQTSDSENLIISPTDSDTATASPASETTSLTESDLSDLEDKLNALESEDLAGFAG